MVEGITRARAVECWHDKPYLVLQVEPIEEDETEHHSARAEAVIRTTYELIEHYCELSTKVSSDIMLTVMGSQKPGYMADYLSLIHIYVGVSAVVGNFDDAQTGGKILFSDPELREELAQRGYFLSSANSINWGRVLSLIHI